MRLSSQDFQKILHSVSILYSNCDPETLPERTDSSVRYLISTEILSFEAFGTDNDYQGPLWYTPANSISDDVLAMIAEFVKEQPFYEDVIASRLRGAVRITDYMPVSKYKQLTVYNEFFRKINTDRQLSAGLHVSPQLMVTCSLCRLKTDFTREDCARFDLLAPHLERAFQNAKFIYQLKAEANQLRSAFESRRCLIITLNSELHTKDYSPIAERVVQKYFGVTRQGLPQKLHDYVKCNIDLIRNSNYYLPLIPWEVSLGSEKLRISLTYDKLTGTCNLYLEEFFRYQQVSQAESLLTNREKEILQWVSAGKTDFQIGLLMSISTRTVQKHLENIFQKLGVETRTSAMAIFLER